MHNEPLCKAFRFLLRRNDVQISLTKSSLSKYYARLTFAHYFTLLKLQSNCPIVPLVDLEK